MSKILPKANLLRAVCGALALILGTAFQAQARGIVADDGSGLQPELLACNLGYSPCNAAFTFTDNLSNSYKFYIYENGLVTIGSPLSAPLINPTGPNALSDIAGLVNNAPFVAVGLNDYASLGVGMVVLRDIQFQPDEITIDWIFQNGPDPNTSKSAIFALQIDDFDAAGAMQLTAGYGAQQGSYFDNPSYNPYCDAKCQPPSGDGIKGVFLPPGSIVGSNLNGTFLDTNTPYAAFQNPFSSTFDYSSIRFTNLAAQPAPVPEPAAWSVMLFGLGAMGVVVGSVRRRRTVAIAA